MTLTLFECSVAGSFSWLVVRLVVRLVVVVVVVVVLVLVLVLSVKC